MSQEVAVVASDSRSSDLLENRDAILRDWVEITGTRLRGRSTRAELDVEQTALLDAARAARRTGGDDVAGEAYAEVRGLLAQLSAARARQGFTPTETCTAVFALKDAVLGRVGTDAAAHADFFAFSKLIDTLGLYTFETYTAARERIITEQSEQLLELSTPVVKIWEGVVAVPLVGTLDSARTQVVMENLLEMIVTANSPLAIIDITGVPTVDTLVAQHLLKTVAAARLMGADCIISGIRPQIAQTIVHLGVDLGDVITKASLADAVRLALQRSGYSVVKSAASEG